MATLLQKSVIRESEVTIDDRNIIITLDGDQSIKMKLKGMKSGEVSISIEDLYYQLSGKDKTVEISEEKKPLNISHTNKEDKNTPMINLIDLRSAICITPMDHSTLSMFDKIVSELIKNEKR